MAFIISAFSYPILSYYLGCVSSCQIACLLHELGSHAEQIAGVATTAAARRPLALEVHLQSHLGSILDGGFLGRAGRDLALGILFIKELAGFGHGQADKGSLALLLARLALVEELQGLQGGGGAEARLVVVVVLALVDFLVLLDGVMLVNVLLAERRLFLGDGAEDGREEVAAARGAGAVRGFMLGRLDVVV
jgi:hypothetical protein